MKYNISSVQVINRYNNLKSVGKKKQIQLAAEGQGQRLVFQVKGDLINSVGQRPVQRVHVSWILLTTRKNKQLQIKNLENLDENSNSDQTYQKNSSKDKKRTKKASDIVETLAK